MINYVHSRQTRRRTLAKTFDMFASMDDSFQSIFYLRDWFQMSLSETSIAIFFKWHGGDTQTALMMQERQMCFYHLHALILPWCPSHTQKDELRVPMFMSPGCILSDSSSYNVWVPTFACILDIICALSPDMQSTCMILLHLVWQFHGHSSHLMCDIHHIKANTCAWSFASSLTYQLNYGLKRMCLSSRSPSHQPSLATPHLNRSRHNTHNPGKNAGSN